MYNVTENQNRVAKTVLFIHKVEQKRQKFTKISINFILNYVCKSKIQSDSSRLSNIP